MCVAHAQGKDVPTVRIIYILWDLSCCCRTRYD